MIKHIIRIECDSKPIVCFETIEYEEGWPVHNFVAIEKKISDKGWLVICKEGHHYCYCPKCKPGGKKLKFMKKNKKIKVVNR